MKNSVRLIYLGRVSRVKEAVIKANEILCNREFYEQIKGYTRFTSTDLSPDIIARLMAENNYEIIVGVSYLALFTQSFTDRSGCIRLSYWNLNKDLPSAVNTLIHETVNAIDYLNNNSRNIIEQPTAPWVIGAIAEIMVK